MMKTKRRMLLLILVLSCMLITTISCSYAEENIIIPVAEKNVYIYDEDKLLTEDEYEKLNSMLIQLEDKTSAEFVVYSIGSLNGASIETYANKVFNTLGIGKKGKDNGILLLISKSDNKVRIEVGDGVASFLTDSKCGRILDEFFVPYREKDEYTKAISMTVQSLVNEVSADSKVTIDGVDSEIAVKEKDSTNAGILIALAALLLAVVICSLDIFEDYTGDSGIYLRKSSGSSFRSGGFGGGFGGGGGASR